MKTKVPVQSLIGHIKTAVDVDPWAKEAAEELLRMQIPMPAEIEGDGRTPFWFYVCGECHEHIDLRDKYCKHCGNAISWAEK
jgi:hypothetical protein